MAFSIQNLSVLAYANGFTMWHYKATRDERISLISKNFFLDAADMLSTGDLLIATTVTGPVLLALHAGDGAVQAMIMH